MDRTFSPRPMVFLLSTLGLLQVTYYIDRELEASPCKPGLKLPKPTVSSQIERPKAGGSISTKTTNAMEPKGKPTAMTLGFTKTVPAAERPNFKEAVSEVTQSTHRKAASFNASSLQGLQQLNASADFKQTVEAFTARISKLSQKSTQLNQEFKVSGDAFEREVDCLVRDTMRGRKELSQVKQSIEDELEDAAALLGSTQDVMRQVYEAKVISEESSLSKSYFQEHKILSTLPPVMVEKKIKLHGSLLEAKDKLSRAQEILLRAECMDSISQERLYGDLKDTSVRTRAMAEKIADLEKEIESLYLNTGRSIYQMKRSTAVTNSLRNHQRDLSQRRWGVLLNAIRSKCASEVSKSSSTPRNSTMTARLNGRWSHVKSFITPSSAIVASPAVFTLEQVPPPQPVEEQVSKPSIIRTPQETNAPVPPVPVAAPSSFSFGAKAEEKPKETKAPVPPVPDAAPSAFSFGAKAVEKPKETKAPVPPVPVAAPSAFSCGAKAEEKPKETKAPVPPVPAAAPSSFSFGAKADEKTTAVITTVSPLGVESSSGVSKEALSETKAFDTATSAFSFSGLSRSINEASESQKSASLGSAFSTAPNSGESKASSTAKVAWGTAAPKSLFQTSPSSTVSASSLSTAGGQPPLRITPASSIFKPASATPISTETTPKPGFFASSPSAAMSFEDKIKGFYAKYNPSKIDEVPGLVAKYHGREQELFEKLEKKYNVKYFSDTPTFGSAPSQVFGAGFGGAGVTSTVFGQNAQLKSPAVEGKSSPFAAPFGGTTPFGQSSGQSLFGTASSTSPAFGKQQTATEISSPSTFGQPAVFGSKFGQPSNVFNAAPNVSSSTPFAKSSPAFGQVSFGQAQLSTLGQGFGATSSSIPFVQTAQAAQGGGSTLFGKPTQPIFGQPSMLGKASNPFGGPSDDSEMAMSDDQPAQGPPAGSSLFGGQFQSQAFKTFR